MKIIFNKALKENLRNVLRQCGYAEIRDRMSGKTSYARRLSSYFYPRFHLYIEEGQGGQLIFNLHLDQKKASYEGQTAHSGEYDNELIQGEAERIKNLIT
ncbi:MAG: Uncharacterized protein Athens101410_573 [Parcubacteria group bacterium Athens1014_10]|nr:MAG: Uncharacterized protein Athens101410_573 [Parcubacteria group bacterium Athens1014_10]TSD04711.1 MAG: Uncharacterized protein Athens071412_655 [Parcubacteria group bacterium Athens0714_12]